MGPESVSIAWGQKPWGPAYGRMRPFPTQSSDANHCPSAPCDSQMWLDSVDIHFLAWQKAPLFISLHTYLSVNYRRVLPLSPCSRVD